MARRKNAKVAAALCSLGVEAADGFYYGGDFVGAEFGVDGEGEYFGGRALGVGEVSGFVA